MTMNTNKFMNNTAAVIVAAGCSSRMKAFKPLLPLAGSTIIRTLIDTMQKVGIAPIVVVSGRDSEQLAEHIADLGVEIVENDRYAQTDMFYSACLGFSAVRDRGERVFFLPVDVPLFSHFSLTGMKEYMDDVNCDILIPSYDLRQGHPILIKNEMLDQLIDYQGAGGLRGAIKNCSGSWERLVLPDPGLIMDADTPEQYLELKEYAQTAAMTIPLEAETKLRIGKKGLFIIDADFAYVLELADKCRSLAKACQQAEVSYSNTWKNIKLAEEQLGFIILQSSRGGAGGGGSKLTRRGKAFLTRYKRMLRSVERYSQKQFEKYFKEEGRRSRKQEER